MTKAVPGGPGVDHKPLYSVSLIESQEIGSQQWCLHTGCGDSQLPWAHEKFRALSC